MGSEGGVTILLEAGEARAERRFYALRSRRQGLVEGCVGARGGSVLWSVICDILCVKRWPRDLNEVVVDAVYEA